VTPLTFTLSAFGAALLAGLVGSLLGVGGGIIVVPALTLLLGVDMTLAVAASLMGVIATSTGAGAAYVREHLVNLRVAMFLEVATVVGAAIGAVLAGVIPERWLFFAFGGVLAYAAFAMFMNQVKPKAQSAPPDPLADRLRLHGDVRHPTGESTPYCVSRSPLAFGIGALAGIVSGLLGVGGGILQVPAMHLGMRMPIKVSTATSNFMMGVTAAGSVGVYFSRGELNPFIAAPVAAGVLIGATTGSRLLPRVRNTYVLAGFVIVLVWTAYQMLRKGFMHAG
jgi:uncharacterized protein